jgi:repressor LexA
MLAKGGDFILKRLSELRKAHNLSQKTLAENLKIAQNTLSQYETGKREPDLETLQAIASYFDVSVDYLLNEMDNPTPRKKSIKIPVLGRVQAGIPIEAIEEIIDYEEITEEMARKGEHFALKIKGNSMEPQISDNDVVIVRKCSDCESGSIAVVLVNGEDATVKRIKKRPEGVMLIPANPAYEAMFYTNEEIASLPLVIIGKVVEQRRSWE